MFVIPFIDVAAVYCIKWKSTDETDLRDSFYAAFVIPMHSGALLWSLDGFWDSIKKHGIKKDYMPISTSDSKRGTQILNLPKNNIKYASCFERVKVYLTCFLRNSVQTEQHSSYWSKKATAQIQCIRRTWQNCPLKRDMLHTQQQGEDQR